MEGQKIVLSQEKCFQIIQKELSHNFANNKNYDFKLKPRNQFDGFLGLYYGLEMSFENKKTKKKKFFVKFPPSEVEQKNFVQDGDCFNIEVGLYTKIFPKLLSTTNGQIVPKCFLGIDNSCIVLEDMVNYKCLDKLDFLSFEHCVIVIQSIARFHATSIIFQEKNKKKILDWCHDEKISINLKERTFQLTLDYFVKNLVHLMDFLIEIDEERRIEYKKKIQTIASNHFKTTAPKIEENNNVLVHADLWTNNILFKYQNEKVKQCCIIDFQMARYCAPAYDLMYFLYSTTSRNLRDEKMEILIKIYFETFKECFKNRQEFDLNDNNIFSLENLKESISEIKINCMIQAFATMTVTFLGKEASIQRIKGLEKLENIVLDEFKKIPKYKLRMLDNLLDLCHNLDEFID